jgi:hypothetical protein
MPQNGPRISGGESVYHVGDTGSISAYHMTICCSDAAERTPDIRWRERLSRGGHRIYISLSYDHLLQRCRRTDPGYPVERASTMWGTGSVSACYYDYLLQRCRRTDPGYPVERASTTWGTQVLCQLVIMTICCSDAAGGQVMW